MKKLLIIILTIASNSSYLLSALPLIGNKNLWQREKIKENASTQTEAPSEWSKFYQNVKKGNTLPIGSAVIAGAVTGGICGIICNTQPKDSLTWIPVWIIESLIRDAIINDLINNLEGANKLKTSLNWPGQIASWTSYLIVRKGKLLIQ